MIHDDKTKQNITAKVVNGSSMIFHNSGPWQFFLLLFLGQNSDKMLVLVFEMQAPCQVRVPKCNWNCSQRQINWSVCHCLEFVHPRIPQVGLDLQKCCIIQGTLWHRGNVMEEQAFVGPNQCMASVDHRNECEECRMSGGNVGVLTQQKTTRTIMRLQCKEVRVIISKT